MSAEPATPTTDSEDTDATQELVGAQQLDECPILDLDLLGLQVDIVAVRGPGNLLGNLLCALVGLFGPS